MDRNFDASLKLVLKSEGGWSDNPKDPGGPTMKGVTLATFRKYVKANATKDDLKKISNDQIATVYRRQYWDAVAGAQLPDGVDFAVFDYAVNSGPARAAKALQSLVKAVVDGRIGPATLKALAGHDPEDVIEALCDQRMGFLKRLPTWKTFGKGWTDRVTRVRAAALAMTRASAGAPVVVQMPDKMPDKPIVVTQTDNGAPVVVPNAPTPDAAKPTLAQHKTGIAAVIALIITLLAGLAKHFGG